MQVRVLPAFPKLSERGTDMGERNAAPSEDSANPEMQAEGVATGNEKLQDKGQQGEQVTTEREDGTFLDGKDRRPPSKAGGSKEGHVVETGMPAVLVEEDANKAGGSASE